MLVVVTEDTAEMIISRLLSDKQAGYHIVGVVTVPDKPSGRGLKMNESAVKKYAVQHQLPLLRQMNHMFVR